jgi:hypothetical protein
MKRSKLLHILLAAAALFSASLACSQSEQNQILTQVVKAGKTAIILGKTAAPPLQTEAAIAAKTAGVVMKTQSVPLQTQAAKAMKTALAGGESAAQTQIAHLIETQFGPLSTQQATQAATARQGGEKVTFTSPFDDCGSSASHSDSPEPGSSDILKTGFSSAEAACNRQQGTINTHVLVFGGKDGNIFKKADQEANASGAMRLHFTPQFSGPLQIDAIIKVNGKTGASAGSATALIDVKDIILSFLITNDLISGFLDLAEGIFTVTFAGVKTDAYLTVQNGGSKQETETTVGGHGYGSSFPIPPYSQSEVLSDQLVTVSLTTQATQGQEIQIAAGLVTTARTYGWAMAYWNPFRDYDSTVVSVTFTQK